MPRGQKSKLRAREKRRQAREETQDLTAVQATTAEVEESPTTTSSVSGEAPQGSSASGPPQKPQEIQSTTSATPGVAHNKSGKNAKSKGAGKSSTSQASVSPWGAHDDLLNKKTGLLVQMMLYKYKMKEVITKADMMRVVSKRYKEYYPEILKKASERLELVFGLELKAVKPTGHSYTVVSLVEGSTDRGYSNCTATPKNGLLMPLLGVIFLNGNRATEAEVWQFLNILGIYDGKTHFIFGEPRKLITKDLVQEKYLEYRQIAGSDPPRYEFLWGPRALAETSKMKVLEFLAKVNDTTPSAFPPHYEEALREEEERSAAAAVAAPKSVATAKAHGPSRIKVGRPFDV